MNVVVGKRAEPALWHTNCTFDLRDSGCDTALDGSYLQRSAIDCARRDSA
jgi:hypothetical protein